MVIIEPVLSMETQCGLWCAAKMQSGSCRNGNESANKVLWDILHKAREETLETGVPIETVRRC